MELSEVCELIVDCEHKTAPTQDTGYPSIRTPNIGRGRFILEDVNRVSAETYRLWTRRAVPLPGDLIMAREAPVGNVAMVPPGLKPCLGQRTLLIRADRSKVEPSFLNYYLNGPHVQGLIHAKTNGATVAHLNMKDVRTMQLPELPPLVAQRRIADILSAYDELVENCLRRIRILEEMARALYREWFILFRFPGREEIPLADSTLGPIPQGWEIKDLATLCTRMNSGGTPRRGVPEYWECGEVDWFKTKELWDSFLFESEEKITDLGLQESSARLFEPGTILMAIYGSPTVGRLGIVTRPSSCNQAALGLVADSQQISQTFLYFALLFLRDHFNGLAQGAAQQNISKEKVANTVVLVPPVDLLRTFGRLADPAFARIRLLQQQLTNLQLTRDLLLPRLLAGQVALDISAVEGVAELMPYARSFSQADLTGEEPALRAAEEAPSYRVERTSTRLSPAAEPTDESPVSIDQIDRTEVLQVIRQVFSEGLPRERDAATRDVARALGYRRTGPRIQEILHTDLITAVRRCILENENGALRICARSITDYDRDFLKQQFLAAIGRTWIDRDTAIRDFCRWLGFARTGPIIEDTARSLINGLLREGRLEGNGVDLIRRS